MLKNDRKVINFRATPEIAKGLNEVVEYLKATTAPGVRITKADAFRYLINLFQKYEKKS
jgi:hypothetical protein